MSRINMKFLIPFIFVNYLTHNAYGLPMPTITVANYDVSTECKEKALTSSSTVVPSINCTFRPEDNDLSTDIDSHIEENTRALFFNIHFNASNENILNFNQSHLYKPTYWVLARGQSGRLLLLLEYDYVMLSLFTLSLNTGNMDIYMKESSPHCMENLNSSAFEIVVRELIVNYIKKHNEDDFICNMNIVDSEGTAEFVYICCNRSSDGKFKCENLTDDYWYKLLGTIKYLLIIYLGLDFPRFLPAILCKTVSKKTRSYKHRLERSPLKLNVLLTRTPHKYFVTGKTAPKSSFKNMEKFYKTLENLEPDVVHKLKIKEIDIKVNETDLIPEGNAPVGLLRSVYDLFVMFKIREFSSVSKCCYADMCQVCRKLYKLCRQMCQETTGENTNRDYSKLMSQDDENRGTVSKRPNNQNCPWYNLLILAMILVLICFLISPLVLWIVFFYLHQKKEYDDRNDASIRRGLTSTYADVVDGKTITIIGIVIGIFSVFMVVTCLYLYKAGQLCRILKLSFKYTRKAFRAMRKRNISEDLFYWPSIILEKCTVHGFCGLCCLCHWLCSFIIFSIWLLCYILSVLYIIITMCVYLTNTKRNPTSTNENDFKCKWLSCLPRFPWKTTFVSNEMITIKFLIFMLVISAIGIGECIWILIMSSIVPFYVGVAVYTLIGVILNVQIILTYLALTFMIVMYAKSCFKYVADRYLRFSETIYKVLHNVPHVLNTITGDDATMDQNENMVFTIKKVGVNVRKIPLYLEITELGELRTSGLLLFINKHNLLCIPKTFFFEACKTHHSFCPGDVLMNYVRAFVMFITIAAYLGFVLVIVLALEGTLSPHNQLLFALAGMFLPWIFQTVIRTHDVSPSTETSNISFIICFNKILETYKQDWPMNDIVAEMSSEVINGPGITITQNTLAESEDIILPVQQTRIDLLINMDEQT